MAEFTLGDFTTIAETWRTLYAKAEGRILFSSPGFSHVWWQQFAGGSELHLGTVMDNGHCIGIAPLRIKDGTVRFIGDDDVCDFLDFVIEPGQEDLFCSTVLTHLSGKGYRSVELSPLLPDSSARRFFLKSAQEHGMAVSCSQVDVTVGIDLPTDLTSYLAMLSGKQRHELLRKERRLNEEGDVTFRISEKADMAEIDVFLHFFSESREDKNKFLTPEMGSFFRAVIDEAAATRILRLGILELNGSPQAVTLGFEYGNEIYLYNSGYNPQYRLLSVGVISKYYHIKHSIESGKKRFDFLKGSEKYKFHLGGKETSIFRCIINNI